VKYGSNSRSEYPQFKRQQKLRIKSSSIFDNNSNGKQLMKQKALENTLKIGLDPKILVKSNLPKTPAQRNKIIVGMIPKPRVEFKAKKRTSLVNYS